MRKIFLNIDIKLVVLIVLLNLIAFLGYTQKTRTVDEKVLYELLEDNFRKDTLILLYEKENILLDTLVRQLKKREEIQSLRIEKLKIINSNLESQRSILENNNKVLTDSNYNLNLYLDNKKKEINNLNNKNKRKRKWIFGFVAENVLLISATIIYIRFK